MPCHHTTEAERAQCVIMISGASRKTQAKFECVECGYENRADLVGKVNVLARVSR